MYSLAACHEDEQRQNGGRRAGGSGDDRGARAFVAAGGAGLRLAEVCFPRVDGPGMRTGPHQFVFRSGQARQRWSGAGFIPVTWKCGMKAAASPGTNAVTGVSSKCSTWSITWMCWSASPAHSQAASRWSSGVEGTLADELRRSGTD